MGYDGNMNYERLLSLSPDIVLLFGVSGASAMEPKLRELGIPYAYMGEYLEQSPLGKAEWLVAVAEIAGMRERGEEVFREIPLRYDSLKTLAAKAERKPVVMLNTPYGDSWLMAPPSSYVARLIADAGGQYVYTQDTGNQSRPIDTEEAYRLAEMSDCWINVGSAASLKELAEIVPKFMDTRPVREGRVYNNNRRTNPSGGNDYWESGVIHPDLILQDLIRIFHPELTDAEPTSVGAVPIPIREVLAALTGSGNDPVTTKIILNIRLLKAVVALLAGAALAVSGLQMQTLFRNPLAGPYVLGISSGASLGVAIFLLGAPLLGLTGHPLISTLGIAGAAWIGSALILMLIAAVSRRIKDIMVILILGMMFSSGVGAVVQILQYLSNEAALKSFVVWTMGSLGDVTLGQLGLLLPAVVLGLVLAVAVIKPLNLLLLGENYARTMGLDIRRSRQLIFLSTTLLAGTVTAFCGPIGFIGLAVPHVARILFADADHRILVPASILTGIVVMLLCDVLAKLLTFPINTITALLGIPIVIWVVIRNKSIV